MVDKDARLPGQFPKLRDRLANQARKGEYEDRLALGLLVGGGRVVLVLAELRVLVLSATPTAHTAVWGLGGCHPQDPQEARE